MAKKETLSENVVNPFDAGVNYKMFTEALGSNKVADYLKDVCTKEQIEWLIEDLKHYNSNK
jgi:hypothetical protein